MTEEQADKIIKLLTEMNEKLDQVEFMNDKLDDVVMNTSWTYQVHNAVEQLGDKL